MRKRTCAPPTNKTLNSKLFRVSLDLFDRIIVVKTEGASCKQVSGIRQDFGNDATLIMSKHSCILAGLADYIAENKNDETKNNKISMLETLPEYLHHEVGIILTNLSIEQIDAVLNKHMLYKRPKLGSKACCDIIVQKEHTRIEPTKTIWFQEAQVQTKILKGTIEIIKSKTICKKGQVVSSNVHRIMDLLNINPETNQLEMLQIFEPGLTYSVKSMMPLVESRVEEAVYEFLCFGLGAGVFTYTEGHQIPDYESSSDSSMTGDDDDLFGLFG
jgi:ribosomal protein L10